MTSQDDSENILIELATDHEALRQEVGALKEAVERLADAELADDIVRRIESVARGAQDVKVAQALERLAQTRTDDDGRSPEQVALTEWFGTLRERLGHADPSFYVSVSLEPGRRVVIEGMPLAFATAVTIGDLEISLQPNDGTLLEVDWSDLDGAGIVGPTEIVVRRHDQTVGRGVLPAT